MERPSPPGGTLASPLARLLVLGLALAGPLLLSAPEAHAFTPETRLEIVRRAATLMPESLQRQLERHVRPLYAGALETMSEGEGSSAHALDPGTADAALAEAIEGARLAVDGQRPMAEVARHLGRIAHAAADLSFALNVGPDVERENEIYGNFGEYVDEMLPKLRITFAGFRDPDLAAGEVERFAARVAADARRDYDAIVRSYFPEGRQPTTQDFDERSIPFAIASLEVSLAVNTTARAWLYAWHSANGDLEGAASGLGNGAEPFGPPPPETTRPAPEPVSATASEELDTREENDESK